MNNQIYTSFYLKNHKIYELFIEKSSFVYQKKRFLILELLMLKFLSLFLLKTSKMLPYSSYMNFSK